MNNSLYMFLLACSVFLGGCARIRQAPEAVGREKESPPMIQIQNLTLTNKTLTLDYRVSNPFGDAIWVCYDTWVHGERDVQNASTTIEGETVRIKLCFNLGRGRGFENPPAVAKYVRLEPGESHSGRIPRNLPIRDYSGESRKGGKQDKEISLHRVVFEVGYLGPKCNEYLASVSERIKREPDKSKPVILGPHYYLAANPFITEETLDGRLRQVMYIGDTSLIENEESAEAPTPITDVNIPCSIVVDER